MAKKLSTRRELLDRWRGIEEDEDEDDNAWSDPSKSNRLCDLKEQWFSDAFNFLICLPKESHIWCDSWDIMGPLLETFYNYPKDERHNSPLKLLWKRICAEMQRCTQCISQHHQALEMYNMEYDSNSVGPLLDVLRSLDEERVAQHLKEINTRMTQGGYDPMLDNAEVVSVMFEVLMFPILLDDQSLVSEFQIFIESIDSKHELALAGHQQYPGVYALLFFKSRRMRSIGLRLAGCMGKLRRAADLDPLQPWLKKCIGFLVAEVLPSTFETSRPRVQLDSISVWLGFKALLRFLEPPAFEEGILERYPIFFSVVLNHISDDSLEFSHAVICLRLLFELLGCKLWLKSTLSPSVMRNTLLGQCFHTRNEKSHKDIFDLFQPFLQSLEALQDGEHEEQRRHFLYFLLHQVTASSNFSILMRKKACQIALLIIHQGYKMNPPCPPYECAHMWGPSLVSSLKDSSLHSSLRQPAFDLIQTIIVSDASVLISSMLNYQTPSGIDRNIPYELNDEEDDSDGLLFSLDVEERDTSSWDEFNVQSKITSCEYREWMCIPMLWLDVLAEIDPSLLPISFSKAVFWARSRFSMVEPENSTEMTVSVRNWLSSSASEISTSFGWKVPTGSDDGGKGKESKNSIKVSTMHLPLIRTFKRLSAHFVVQMEQGELRKQWTWEPKMSESLILLLLDSNDNVRQVARCILEQVSNMRGLVYGLQFLCSCTASLSAMLLGLRHAFKLIQLDSVLLNFQTLHNFFFVVCKLLKEGVSSTAAPHGNPLDDLNISKFSSQGGFLRQPLFDAVSATVIGPVSSVETKYWEKFSLLVSEFAWPSIRKCLVEGKAYIDNKISQMTCVRLLEILPVVFERLHPSVHKPSGDSRMVVDTVHDFKWLHDLMDWGSSPLEVIVRYWKRAVISLLDVLKETCSDSSTSTIRVIENLISRDSIAMDELAVQVSRLSVSLSNEASCDVGKTKSSSKVSLSEDLSFVRKYSASDALPFSSEEADVQILSSAKVDCIRNREKPLSSEDDDVQILSPSTVDSKRDGENVIILSDDESEAQGSLSEVITSHTESSQCTLGKKTLAPGSDKRVSEGNAAKKKSSTTDSSKKIFVAADSSGLATEENSSDTSRGTIPPASLLKTKGVYKRNELNSKPVANNSLPSQGRAKLNSSSEILKSRSVNQASKNVAFETSHTVGKSLPHVTNTVADPWDTSLKSARPHQSGLTKPRDATDSHGLATHEKDYDSSRGRLLLASLLNVKGVVSKRPEINSKELLHANGTENDPWEVALKSARSQQSNLTNPSKPVSKRQVIQLNLPFENRPGSLRRLEAEVKRFKPPNLDDWFRPILNIDYFAAVGLTPVSKDENQSVSKLKEVPVYFQSPEEYVNIFRPLVLEEFKAQLHSSFLEMSSLEEICFGSLSVLSVERIDDFNLVRCVHDDSDSAATRSFSENDLVLLTKQPLQNSSHDVHMVGKVERRERDNKRKSSILLIRFYLQSGSSRSNRARKLLIERSKWYVGRIMSITPQLREFLALSSLTDIPLLATILNPFNGSFGYDESRKFDLRRLPQPLQRVLESSFNDSQLQAISFSSGSSESKKNIELSLIQGPPGTGKTRTIVAIVSALLASPLQRINDSKHPLNGNIISSSTSCNNSRAQISQSVAIARAWQDAALARQMNEDAEKCSKSGNSVRGRVLICAQSNAAVDELVSRISSEGLYGSDGKMFKPYLVRVGNAKTVHPTSLPFFIDTLVDQRLADEKMILSDAKNDMSGDNSVVLRSNLEKLVDRIRFFETKRANLMDENSDLKSSLKDEVPKEGDGKEMSDAEIESKLKKLYEQKKQVYKDLATAQARERKANEESRALKHKLRKSILKEASIVVTTLSGCGGDLYGVCSESTSGYKFSHSSENNLFDAVVIDEAAQALEPATLIPLQLLKSKGTKCIMVGDPKQLPATVLSNVASKFLYQCSMFERLQRAGHPVIMLTKQYRMHPEICRFPSLHFYDSKLLNGEQMSSKSAPFHETEGLGPYVFFDVVDGQELRGKNSGALSLYNEREADAAIEVMRFFRKRYPSEFVSGRIGIITPYKSQLSLLRSRFSSVFGSSVTADIEFNTVDGFQGREVDILVLSTVRAAVQNSPDMLSSIGFVADVRRMNVALTRAKLSLWILGNARTLRTNNNWAALVKDAKERNLVVSAKIPYNSMFKISSRKRLGSENSDKGLKGCEKVKNSSWHANHIVRSADDGRCSNSNGAGAKDVPFYKKIARDDPSSENHYNHSRWQRHGERVKNTSWHARHMASSAEETQGGRPRINPKVAVGEHNTSGTTKELQTNRKRVRDEDGRSSTDVKSAIPGKAVREDESNAKNFNEKKNNSEKVRCNDKKNEEVSTSSSVPMQVDTPTDIIAKRKQQREAVDALLSSALISSKKPETLLKSGPSTSIASGGMKPPKAGKVRPTSALQEQNTEHIKKREKTSGSLNMR